MNESSGLSYEDIVRMFKSDMLAQKREWDEKKGDTWKTTDMDYLRSELKRQLDQVDESRHYVPQRNIIMHELVDLANLACMIWWRYASQEKEGTKEVETQK